MRYNKKYQELADKFAIKYGKGEWIGAEYVGRHRQLQPAPGSYTKNWMVFRPIRKDNEPRKVGVYKYILIEEEEISLFSTLAVFIGKGKDAEENGVFLHTEYSPNILSLL